MIKGNIKPIALEEVENLHPEGKDPHLSISHKDLYLAITRCASKKMKWSVEDAQVGLSNNQLMSAITIQFEDEKLPSLGNKLLYSFGIFNSNNRHHAMRFFAGVAGSNFGIVLHDVPVTKKHSINTQVGDVVLEAMEVAAILMEDYAAIVDELRSSELSKEDVDRILMQAGRMKLMPWSRIGGIDDMFFQSKDASRWTRFRLLACFGKQVHRNPARFQLQQMYGFQELVGEVVHV